MTRRSAYKNKIKGLLEKAIPKASSKLSYLPAATGKATFWGNTFLVYAWTTDSVHCLKDQL